MIVRASTSTRLVGTVGRIIKDELFEGGDGPGTPEWKAHVVGEVLSVLP